MWVSRGNNFACFHDVFFLHKSAFHSNFFFFRPRKKPPVFPLTCSKILGSVPVGRKKILLFKIFLTTNVVSTRATF